MKSLIIGKGQVGTGLFDVISPFHETYIKDVEELEIEGIEVLHLCYPYSDKFIDTANDYIKKYSPKLVINHASVAIGTTEKIDADGSLICYSPIRGKHPNLAGDIRIFDKFIAGEYEAVSLAKEYFKPCGMGIVMFSNKKDMRTLEFCKLVSNIRYGYEICFMQEMERIADEFGIDIGTFNLFEQSYNNGYKVLGQYNMIRPVLYGGVIGGHCVMQCTKILKDQHYSELFDWMEFSNIKKINEIEKTIEKGAN